MAGHGPPRQPLLPPAPTHGQPFTRQVGSSSSSTNPRYTPDVHFPPNESVAGRREEKQSRGKLRPQAPRKHEESIWGVEGGSPGRREAAER